MFKDMVSHISEHKFKTEAQTGDIILCNGRNSLFSSFVEYFTSSKFSHIGIIIKNPDFEIEIKDKDPNGLYLLHSTIWGLETDVLTHRNQWGVKLVSLDAFFDEYRSKTFGYGYLYYRKLHLERNLSFKQKTKELFTEVHQKSYDLSPLDWLKARFSLELGDVHRHDQFWCSALVGFFYVEWGLLDKDLAWSLLTPRRFSHYENCELSFHSPLDPEKWIDLNK